MLGRGIRGRVIWGRGKDTKMRREKERNKEKKE
jgi:hypothetical protein